MMNNPLLLCSILLSGLVLVYGQEDEVLPYLTDVKCDSPFKDKDYHVELKPGLTFHWAHPQENYGKQFRGALQYEGKGWLAVGFTKEGKMQGSKAIIGIPGDDEGVKAYNLNDMHLSGVVQDDEETEKAGLVGHVYTHKKNTTMHFHMDHVWDITKGAHPVDSVFNMIYAVGSSNVLGMHKDRGSFRIFTQGCPVPEDPAAAVPTNSVPSASSTSSSSTATATTYDHKAAFAAHGFFAMLAFTVVIPCALLSAWFRSLIPKWWIYIHVLGNCLGVFFTTTAVVTAFAGMVLRGKSVEGNDTHMTVAHHWVGLVLFMSVLFQVFNGFRRPTVDAKVDPTTIISMNFQEEEQKTKCLGIVLETSRDKWHALHRLTALIVIGMALFQLDSGLKLYTTEYGGNTKAALITLWVWVGSLFVFVGVYTVVTKRRSQKLRSSTKNIMPQREEEEEHTFAANSDEFGGDGEFDTIM